MAERLIIGASGFLGGAILRKFGLKGTIATGFSNISDKLTHFDVTKDDLNPVLQKLQIGAPVIFLFGITKIEDCATNKVFSRQINVDVTIRHIESVISAKCKPVFVSTDAVFDGTKGNYKENDETGPLHQYALQKLEVENYLAQVDVPHLVIRLPKVVSSIPEKHTLFYDWIEKLERGEVIRCAEDQIFSPIEAGDVADCVFGLLKIQENGIFHIGGPENLSRADLYDILINEIGCIYPNNRPMIRCNIYDFDEVIEDRPIDCSLNSDRLKLALGERLKFRTMYDVCVEIREKLYSGKINFTTN